MTGNGVFGQQYKTAVGVKGDWSNINVDMAQFSVKHFFSSPSAVEVNFGAARRFVWLEGMYHYNSPIANGFDWYVGGGVDLGYRNKTRDDTYEYEGFWGGTTGVLGVEYTFDVIPLNFALDVGPTMRLLPDMEVGLKMGFAARYAFGH